MGMWLTKLVNGVEEMRIVMMGLDGVGKTTILYQLKLQKVVDDIPTQGENIETLEYNNIKFTLRDIGGQQRYKIRDLWKHYFQEARGLIYVVDSNDPGRIEEARDELHTLLQQDALRDAVLLVLANKQDCPNAMTTSEITHELQLHSLSHRPWYIQATCATSGEGLYQGLDWLSSTLPSHAS